MQMMSKRKWEEKERKIKRQNAVKLKRNKQNATKHSPVNTNERGGGATRVAKEPD